MDGGACWATVHGVAKSRTRLSDFTLTFISTRCQWHSVYTYPTEVVLLFVHSYEGWGLLLGLSYHQSPYSTESKTNVRILQ